MGRDGKTVKWEDGLLVLKKFHGLLSAGLVTEFTRVT